MQRKMREMDNEDSEDNLAYPVDTTVPCVPWSLEMPPTRLPPIPPLPNLPDNGVQEEERRVELIQIAGFDNFLVGLTNMGHVLIFDSLHDETGVPHGHWEYVNIILCVTMGRILNIISAPKIQ